MPFSSIQGHSNQIRALRRALEQGRLHHAYLFLGPEGVGKKTIALSLAMALQCSGRSSDFCGECANCRRVRDGNHPDVRLMGPLPGKREIGIQQIRELERELRYRSFSGGKKVAILDPASLMNAAAQNALLKTLEEPPKDSLLILIAPGAGSLLPTLVSRCLRLPFAPLPEDLMIAFLVSQKGMNREEATFLTALTLGSLGKALTAEMAAVVEGRRIWVEKMTSLGPRDYRGALLLAEELSADKEKTPEFLAWLAGWYRDVLVHAVTNSSGGIANLDLIDRIERQSAARTVEQLIEGFYRAVESTKGVERNLNRRMILEDLFLNVVRAP